jgi:hypothetical protein
MPLQATQYAIVAGYTACVLEIPDSTTRKESGNEISSVCLVSGVWYANEVSVHVCVWQILLYVHNKYNTANCMCTSYYVFLNRLLFA